MGQGIGTVGVGGLGIAIAERLIAAGHRVTGYRRGALDALVAAGGHGEGDQAAIVEFLAAAGGENGLTGKE